MSETAAETRRRRFTTLERLLVFMVVAGVVLALVVAAIGLARQNTIREESRRRDCITLVSTARRSVFDDVDIYKAIQIQQLSTALLNGQQGIHSTADDIAAFAANDRLLEESLVEARRIQPPAVLQRLVAHGGMIDGTHYDACP